jgi:hypothetical protein
MELIKGNSGCKLTLSSFKNKLVINKSTADVSYAYRLELQALKQIQFKNYTSKYQNIIVPEVFNQKKTKTSFLFQMEYYLASDSISFLENSDIDAIDSFTNNIIKLIDLNLTRSTQKKIDKKLLIDKLDKVEKSILDKKISKLFRVEFDSAKKQLKNLDNEIYLPCGVCHGDLTLSNILIQDGKFILIDFLDSFIETPLQDIVKIRQDTSHFWSLNLIETNIDITKLKILLSYMDNKIEEYYKNREFMRFYDIFQAINLLRIIPYSHEEKLILNLKEGLDKLNNGS